MRNDKEENIIKNAKMQEDSQYLKITPNTENRRLGVTHYNKTIIHRLDGATCTLEMCCEVEGYPN